MTERRDRIDIYADILSAIDKEDSINHIVCKTNLNFCRFRRYITNLFRGGLIKVQSNSPSTWAITDQGRIFLKEYEKIRDIFPISVRGKRGEEGK